MHPNIKVFKFGGASLKDPDNIKNVAGILRKYAQEKLLIVVSAIGKTTNALEKVVEAHAQQTGKALTLLEAVQQAHYDLCQHLFDPNDEVFASVNDTFVEVEWVLEEAPHPNYDYMYDQIVSIGELVSSKIVHAYLNKIALPTQWLDARDVIRTNELYRESWVQWSETELQAKKTALPLFEKPGFVITQGFIGSTQDNYTTTLGRDGSDYSAAIFSFCLDAQDMTIWKDAAGVLSADPRFFDNAEKLDQLSFREAIEMTYYGAKVIHLKTTGPLERKNIPLYVKSFLDPSAPGTYIAHDVEVSYPPMVMMEKNQAFLEVTTRDFSFVSEVHLSELFQRVAELRLQVNLVQNTAMTFYLAVNDQQDKVDRFVAATAQHFEMKVHRGLELLTIRHGDAGFITKMTQGKTVLLNQICGETAQMVVE
jgi:aspartate kinase